MDDETSLAEKKRGRINAIKQRKEENKHVTCRVDKILDKGIIVRTGGLYALIPFRFMPWNYTPRYLWNVIFPSLVGKYINGYIFHIDEELSHVYVKANTTQFDPFQYEIDEIYTAIVLRKINTSLLVDFGYGFDWKHGSLEFKIVYSHKEKEIDWFPYYNAGDEFKAVYLGKSVSGNDIFGYDGNYYSKEHELTGQKIWVNLEKTESGLLRFLYHYQYIGELFLDEKNNTAVSYKLLHKILQTLPNGQRLWCEVINVTFDGTLQLQWLIDTPSPVEDVLSIYSDTSVLNINVPFLSEEKKALINKKVWCLPCESVFPRKFKIENQYFGTIAMDANLYQDIALTQIINAIDKIPNDQQIFCKIKGIYPDGTFKLQWLVQWDGRAEKLVYPNRFSQKIHIKTEREKKQALIGQETWAKIQNTKGIAEKIFLVKNQYSAIVQGDDFIRQELQLLPSNTTIFCKVLGLDGNENLQIEYFNPKYPNPDIIYTLPAEAEQWIGKEVEAKIKWISPIYPKAMIEGRYIADIITKGKIGNRIIRQMVKELPDGQPIRCLVENVEGGIIYLDWLIDKDPCVQTLPALKYHLKTLEMIHEQLKLQMLVDIEKEQYIGQTLSLEVQQNLGGIPRFLIDGKHEAIIVVSRQYYSGISLNTIKKALVKILVGDILLCEVVGATKKFLNLRWQIEDDPCAAEFLSRECKQKKIKIPFEKQEEAEEQKNKKRKVKLENPYIGQRLSLEVKQNLGGMPRFLIGGKHEAIMVASRQYYSGISLNTIRKALAKVLVGDILLCEVVGATKKFLNLRWLLEDDPRTTEFLSRSCKGGKIKIELTFQEQESIKEAKKVERIIAARERKRIKKEQEIIEQEKQRIKQEIIERENKEREEYVGQTLSLKVMQNTGTPRFLIDGKHEAIIIVDWENYSNIPLQHIRKTLTKILVGEHLLCKVQKNSTKYMELRWMLEDDPCATEFLKRMYTSHDTKKKKILHVEVPLIGQIVKATIITPAGDVPPLCLTDNQKFGYLSMQPDLYKGIARQKVEQAYQQLAVDDRIVCKILGIYSNEKLHLKWLMEDDPCTNEILSRGNNFNTEQKMIEQENNEQETIILSKKGDTEIIKVKTPHIQALKIVGKVDIDAINTRIRPKKKSKEQLHKEAKECIQAEQQQKKALEEARQTKWEEQTVEEQAKK